MKRSVSRVLSLLFPFTSEELRRSPLEIASLGLFLQTCRNKTQRYWFTYMLLTYEPSFYYNWGRCSFNTRSYPHFTSLTCLLCYLRSPKISQRFHINVYLYMYILFTSKPSCYCVLFAASTRAQTFHFTFLTYIFFIINSPSKIISTLPPPRTQHISAIPFSLILYPVLGNSCNTRPYPWSHSHDLYLL